MRLARRLAAYAPAPAAILDLLLRLRTVKPGFAEWWFRQLFMESMHLYR